MLLYTFIIAFKVCDGQLLLCVDKIAERLQYDLWRTNKNRASGVHPERILLLMQTKHDTVNSNSINDSTSSINSPTAITVLAVLTVMVLTVTVLTVTVLTVTVLTVTILTVTVLI